MFVSTSRQFNAGTLFTFFCCHCFTINCTLLSEGKKRSALQAASLTSCGLGYLYSLKKFLVKQLCKNSSAAFVLNAPILSISACISLAGSSSSQASLRSSRHDFISKEELSSSLKSIFSKSYSTLRLSKGVSTKHPAISENTI